MLYDQYFIDELKARADLVRLIQPYAQDLKKKGASWIACCPFHQEKTPSFSVNPLKGFYKCFGCGKGGNAFTFLMEMEGLNFPEAVQRVAEMNGVPLPRPIDDRQYEQNKKRKEEKKKLADQVVDLNKLALEFWNAELQGKGAKAKAAREYLEKRGISDEIQQQFHIGFAPDSWDSLINHLKETSADENLIEQSGLVTRNEERNSLYDRFRGRIIFPVLDVNGNPVAFGARAMGDEQPKYLNSPETPAYIKGRHLYGLFQSKEAIRQKKFAILVEGYLDLIALFQFGITNVAASLGTAFTPEQSKLLSRFTKQVVINYDGDSAGIAAARKAVECLLADNFNVKVFVIPGGEDPDDFIRKNGPEEYNRLRGTAKRFVHFFSDPLIHRRKLVSPHDRSTAAEEMLTFVRAVRNPVEKRETFDEIMQLCQISDHEIIKQLWRSFRSSLPTPTDAPQKLLNRAFGAKITVAEQHLLELILHDGELRAQVLELLEETDYETLATAPIFTALYELEKQRSDPSIAGLLNSVGDDEYFADLVPLLMMSESKRAEGDAIDDVLHDAENCIFTLRSMAIENRINEVNRELMIAEQARDQIAVNELASEQIELTQIRRSLLNKIAQT